MNIDFLMGFVLLFGASIAVICAVYVALIQRAKLRAEAANLTEEDNYKEVTN